MPKISLTKSKVLDSKWETKKSYRGSRNQTYGGGACNPELNIWMNLSSDVCHKVFLLFDIASTVKKKK